ncbi:2-oxo acid dehydrogenase subunit E2 [Treponema sp. OMZ 840]|uniref:dihydrolipoamide acetyltransferase family protein n=1 Tax=Treponema sp. OMZ 840 TaxID=244313 RepID=UPI003D8FC148
MAHVLIMPRQGNTVESCIIVEWKKKEGDAVDADTTVCEVETDKATFEVPAGAAGTILKIIHPEGDDVPVLQPIMVVGNAGEDWTKFVDAGTSSESAGAAESVPAAQAPAQSPADAPAPSAPAVQTLVTQASAAQTASGGHLAVSPRARAAALKEVIDVSTLTGTGAEGRIIEADVLRAASQRPPLTAAAKEALRSGGAIPASGSGIGGRVTLEDIAAVASGAKAVLAQGAPAGQTGCAASKADEYTDTPIKGIRKVIAERMMSSLATSAQFTLNASASAVRMQKLRERFKASDPAMGLSKVTVNDLILFLASRLLKDYSYMNAVKKDGVVREYKNVHLGMAVDTPRGLMVPVIRNADTLSLAEISAQAKYLAGECQNGSISPDLLGGSSFTITNLGNTGIESFTPVINAPEVAILGVCGIQPKPEANAQGSYDIVPHLSFSLTIDHAVVDGAPAARFMKALCLALKDIDIWIAK